MFNFYSMYENPYARERRLIATIKEIAKKHKRWSKDWYCFFEKGLYRYTKECMKLRGKGETLNTSLNIIDEIIRLEEARLEAFINWNPLF